MTLASEITADTTGVFLDTDDFGESITHWPSNVEDDAATRTVVFVEGERLEEDREDGKYLLRKAVIHIVSTVTITKKDAWFRNSERWETLGAARLTNGMREVHLMRAIRINTKPVFKGRKVR